MKSNRTNAPSTLSCIVGLLAVFAVMLVGRIVASWMTYQNINAVTHLQTDR